MFNLFNWSKHGPSSNASLKRLKRSLGAGLSLLLLFLATAAPEEMASAASAELAQNETGYTIDGNVIVGEEETIPAGTEAWLISDHHPDPLGEPVEDESGVIATTDVDVETGNFSFSDVSEGFYLVVINPPADSGYASTNPVFVEVSADYVGSAPDILLSEIQLYGNVMDSVSQEPIEARVELFHTTEYFFYQTKTVSGTYSFGGLEFDGVYEISVWPDEDEPYAFSGFEQISVTVDSLTYHDVVLDPPALVGQVVDPDGSPMRDVTVSAWQKHDDGNTTGPLFGDNGELPTYADDWTSHNGTFALGSLQPGTYVIEAYAGHYNDLLPPEPIEVEIPYEGEGILIQFEGFESGLKVLSGVVQDSNGNPITDARVQAQHMTNFWWRSTETDENGEYSLDLIGGEWNVWIERIHEYKDDYGHPPECPPDDSTCEIPECPPEDLECEFPGCPPEDLECEFPSCPPEDLECEFPECPPEDLECVPECPVSVSECELPFVVTEEESDWIYTGAWRYVTFAEDETQETLTEDFEVTSANSTIVGTILNSDGSTPTYWISIGAYNSEGHGSHTQPDNTGYFELAVPAGAYEIFIHADFESGAEPPEVIRVFVDEEETHDLGEIFMVESTSSISGQVTSNGSPLKDVTIIAWKIDGFAHRETQTNSNGDYTLNTSPGLWFVTPAYSPDSDFVFNDPGIEVEVEDGSAATDVDFSVIASKSKIKGVIVDADGNLLTDGVYGWVHVESIDETVETPAGVNEECPPEDLECEFPECPPEAQDCEFPECPPEAQDCEFPECPPEAQDCEFPECPPEAQDCEFPECPPEAQDCEFPECPPEAQDCEFPECPPEAQDCEFPECPPEDLECEFPGECTPEDFDCGPHPEDCADGTNCEPHPGECDGGEDGDPNTPANEDPLKDEPCFGGYKPPEFMTGAPINNGSFSVQVPAGNFRVMVFVDGEGIFANQELEVTVGVNDIQEVTISVQSANSTISGQLVDARTEEPVDLSGDDDGFWFADVFAWSGNNFTHAFIDQDTGTYSMDVISGTWHVDHWLGEHSEYVAVFNPESTVDVGDNEDVTFDLPVVRLDSELTGQVLDPQGNPVSGAEVIIRGTGSFEDVWLFKQTDGSGTYRINVAYGDYVIEAAYVGGDQSTTWFMPEPVSVTVDENSTTEADPLQFREADATLSGDLTITGATTNGYAWVWAWSETGGFNQVRVEVTSDGTDGSASYEMAVIDGTWFVDAVYQSGNNFWFGESEVSVSGDTTQDLTLAQETIELPDTAVQTFAANEPFEMSMDDGTKISIPAGAMPVAVTETVSISIDPVATLPDQDHAEVVNYGYQILAKDSNGALIEQDFNQDVELTFRYDPDQTANIPETALKVAFYSTTKGQWEYITDFFIDEENNTITILIDHFTDFAVVGDPSDAVAETSSFSVYLPMIVR